MIQVAHRICCRFQSSLLQTRLSICAVLFHEIVFFKLREAFKRGQQDWSCECYSYVSNIVDQLDIGSWWWKLVGSIIKLIIGLFFFCHADNRQFNWNFFLVTEWVSQIKLNFVLTFVIFQKFGINSCYVTRNIIVRKEVSCLA